LSPNNVASETKRLLRDNGFIIPKGMKSRVIVNNKEYTLTTTSYKQDTPDARQYDTSTNGLVTLWLRDGIFYIYDRFLLDYGSSTRELGPDEFVQVIAELKFSDEFILNNSNIPKNYREDVVNGLKDATAKTSEILKYIK
jgi:hypothetical protein